MAESKAIQRLDEKMASLEPGTIRYETLEAAKRFKSSWVELGRMLWNVWREKKFREWGYLTFEAYCSKEIGIRAATAKKLLHSYYFLEKEEPTVLKQWSQQPPKDLPSAESVNLLRLLSRRQGGLPAEGYRHLRSYVLEKGGEPLEVRREVRSLLESTESDSEAARRARRETAIRRMVGTLKGLSRELVASKLVPQKLLSEIHSLIKKLEEAI